ncbi:hypothetical protein EVJ50_06245 [Synechococcus sp. RSCCF101]|nr:hypothetical protein EVJ50_06245 [Synechococcus sp. RSCCF101]
MIVALALGVPAGASAQTAEAGRWRDGDRQLYDNKMALLVVLLEAALQRAQESGDEETACLIMSIGNDVTAQYLISAPGDQAIRDRLSGLKRDLASCLERMPPRLGPGF